MSYLVLARKYRPSSFESVAGQPQVTRTLQNAIKRNKVVHAFLFTGPRGVGKTSVARVLSKALNCEKGPTSDPCLECSSCREIEDGRSIAVREIDGASHNSVDNVRELIDTLRTLPPPGAKYKIYIIDEVHMLSTSAFNALLKSLEEPPPNTVFIMATTEIHKIPETVMSRCQRHDFKALSVEVIQEQLRSIGSREGLKIQEGALRAIARLADGSMRDSQTLLDRVQSFADGGEILESDVRQVLGVVEKSALFLLSKAILDRKAQESLQLLVQIFGSGVDPRLFIQEFVAHWRELLFAKMLDETALVSLGFSSDDVVEFMRQVESISKHDAQDLCYLAREGGDQSIRSNFPKYSMEALVIRMATREPVVDLATFIKSAEGAKAGVEPSQITKLKNQVNTSTDIRSENKRQDQRASIESTTKLNSEPVHDKPTLTKSSIMDWRAFVSYVTTSQSKMLGEQLKRLHPSTFIAGKLVLDGPAFSIDYFKVSANLEKLRGLLAGYHKVATSWEVLLREVKGAGQIPGSLVHEDVTADQKKRLATVEDVEKHPAIEKIKKLFPGSEVEVKVS